MTKKITLLDGLLDQLKDLYSAETQLLKMMPRMEKKSQNERLKEAFMTHRAETEKQVGRLGLISELLGQKLTGKTCKAMRGLIEEGQEVLDEDSDNNALIDAMLISAAQRVEHYEIAGYGTARAFAEELGLSKVAKLLQETLDEESEADKLLSFISEEEVLEDADRFTDEADERNSSDKRKKTESNEKRAGAISRGAAVLVGIVLTALMTTMSWAESREGTAVPSPIAQQDRSTDADNTDRNKRFSTTGSSGGEDMTLSSAQRELLASIRREIVANEQLSTNAHNVKILFREGSILLRGPVVSATERIWIAETTGRLAKGIPVINELEVIAG